jgi:hypothetical protein
MSQTLRSKCHSSFHLRTSPSNDGGLCYALFSSYPHRFGPFVDQGCKVVFNKTSVTVFHPNGHPILKGWRDIDGPRFWQFPLTAPPSPPAHLPHLAPIAGGLSAAMSAFLPHPSQGFWATSAAGEDIQIMFLQEVTQSMAMTAQASSTPYNPQTLNLPSISALVSFYHACLGFSLKQMWLDAIKAGNCAMDSHTPTWQDIVPMPTKQSLGILPNSTRMLDQPSPNGPPPHHLQHCPPLPLVLRICHPIKFSSRCNPSAGCTLMTLAAFLSGHSWGTNTS